MSQASPAVSRGGQYRNPAGLASPVLHAGLGQMESEIDAEFPTALYRLYDASGQLLYVGVTANLRERFGQHASTKQWWGDVARRTVTWLETRDEALTAEAKAILTEAPRYNVKAPLSVAMDRRSWYMPKASADALADAVEDLHYATRRPKHEVLAALIDAALASRGDVQARLTTGGETTP